jgi:hypothetical protein
MEIVFLHLLRFACKERRKHHKTSQKQDTNFTTTPMVAQVTHVPDLRLSVRSRVLIFFSPHLLLRGKTGAGPLNVCAISFSPVLLTSFAFLGNRESDRIAFIV